MIIHSRASWSCRLHQLRLEPCARRPSEREMSTHSCKKRDARTEVAAALVVRGGRVCSLLRLPCARRRGRPDLVTYAGCWCGHFLRDVGPGPPSFPLFAFVCLAVGAHSLRALWDSVRKSTCAYCSRDGASWCDWSVSLSKVQRATRSPRRNLRRLCRCAVRSSCERTHGRLLECGQVASVMGATFWRRAAHGVSFYLVHIFLYGLVLLFSCDVNGGQLRGAKLTLATSGYRVSVGKWTRKVVPETVSEFRSPVQSRITAPFYHHY